MSDEPPPITFKFKFNGYYNRHINNRPCNTTVEQLTSYKKDAKMRTKHTPGPWTAKVTVRDPDSGEPLAYCINSKDWEGLATVYGSDDPADAPEYRGHGNAALITAAPALLQACAHARALLQNAEYCVSAESASEDVRIARELLDAAIRQATTEVE